ncbi:hypothetical protein Kpho01_35550 [Kitasatospora phosalacinea]|uniref:Uncharacterized protein n=1 Tax=Kitasatospora phosalacinea TaxID=2065 RepID=A0A9W6UP36_9ACTN|nr:hypothetical protein Kpho01_35550 [Kitasatospora phosalacinea]
MHLGVERWLLDGASWGSTLIPAYAQQPPERVGEIVLQTVTTTRRAETDWLHHRVSAFRPEAWDRFRAAVPEHVRDGDVYALPAAYARRTVLEALEEFKHR